MTRRYARLPYPWRAAVDVGSEGPSRHLAALIGQAARYGMPARRVGSLGALVLRAMGEARPLASLFRRFPTTELPEFDRMIDAVVERWDEWGMVRRSDAVSALILERSAATTLFLFDGGYEPVVVCKKARGNQGVEVEAGALKRAEPADIGPRYLGHVDGIHVQQAVRGGPPKLPRLRASDACGLRWERIHAEITDGLARLCTLTATSEPADELSPWIETALDSSLSEPARKRLEAAYKDVESLRLSVLRHGDTSVQNCLVHEGSFQRLVDWELAKPKGCPGFDTLNFAIAYLEHSLGSRRWSESVAVDALRSSWNGSDFFKSARSAARTAAISAGVSAERMEALEIAFFGRRLGRRLHDPGRYGTGPGAARAILEFVCAS